MSRVPIFLINLDRSPDRLSFMQKQAERLSLVFERIRGVDGVRGLPDWLIPQFLSSDGAVASRMSNGEVGCYASHLVVFQEMVRRGLEAAIVLEDDVTLADDFLAARSQSHRRRARRLGLHPPFNAIQEPVLHTAPARETPPPRAVLAPPGWLGRLRHQPLRR